MAGYVRQHDAEISNGNIIDANLFKAEYDQLQIAFNATAGHKHDGTSGEGAPITVIGPSQDVQASALILRPRLNNQMDLGTSSFRWKGGFFATLNTTGAATIGGAATVTGNLGVAAINATGTVTAPRFSGAGSAITALNASNIASGTLADARLTSNVALLNNTQTISGSKTFSNTINLTNISGIRHKSTDYGVIQHNNNTEYYFLLTNQGDPDGAFNSLRPFRIDLSTGKVTMNNGLTLLLAPTVAGDATRKDYVDTLVSNLSTTLTTSINTKANSAVTLTAGDGLSGGGNLTANRSFAVDSTVVRTGRTLTAGDGLSGGGDLSANRSFSVDSTVVRTTGTQTIGGAKTFSATVNAPTFNATSTSNGGFQGIAADSASNPSFTWTGDLDTGIFRPSADAIGFATGGSQRAFVNNTGIGGNGSQLTSLNGANISSGTIPDARLSSNVMLLNNTQTITGTKTFSATVNAATFNATSTIGGGFRGTDTDSAAAPSFTWTGDLDTGIYRHGANDIGFSCGGTVRGRVTSSGFVGNGSGLTNVDAASMSGISVTAGNGLTGGGALSASRTLTLGTPSSITPTSTNSVTGTSHTHEISEGTIRQLIALGPAGGIGTYIFARYYGTGIGAGNTVSGSDLLSGGIVRGDADGLQEDWRKPNDFTAGGAALSGTWRCMGRANSDSTSNRSRMTLWLRIS